MIRAIAAVDDKLGIAAPGNPPFHIPWRIFEDLRHFRQLTEGGVVLMGRSSYDLLEVPLSNRRNVVASHSQQALRPGFELTTNVDSFVREAQQAQQDIWIIGGAALYASTLAMTDELYITHVQGDFHCNLFFPKFVDQFELKQQSEWLQEESYVYQFAVYKKPASQN